MDRPKYSLILGQLFPIWPSQGFHFCFIGRERWLRISYFLAHLPPNGYRNMPFLDLGFICVVQSHHGLDKLSVRKCLAHLALQIFRRSDDDGNDKTTKEMRRSLMLLGSQFIRNKEHFFADKKLLIKDFWKVSGANILSQLLLAFIIAYVCCCFDILRCDANRVVCNVLKSYFNLFFV